MTLRTRAPGQRSIALYKEWKLLGRAGGSGVFAPGAAVGHTLTLGQFLHQRQRLRLRTLVMQGPKANYSMFGDLKRAP